MIVFIAILLIGAACATAMVVSMADAIYEVMNEIEDNGENND